MTSTLRVNNAFMATAALAAGLATALASGFVGLGASSPAAAAEKVVARVNGQNITEADLKLAAVEVGSDLGNLPPQSRRLVLVEYLIENFLFADAANARKLGSDPEYDKRIRYWKRRALRDTFFEKTIRNTITEADARRVYDEQVKAIPPREEVRALHILVKTKPEALDIIERLNRGEKFADLAKAHSIDPGSKDRGGDLGYFSKGQMVPAFEKAAFALKKGEISDPVKSRFGYHIIKLEDKRITPPPAFAKIKDRMIMSMMHRKAQQVAQKLRKSAKIEYIDPEIKKQAEAQASGRGSGLGGAQAQ